MSQFVKVAEKCRLPRIPELGVGAANVRNGENVEVVEVDRVAHD